MDADDLDVLGRALNLDEESLEYFEAVIKQINSNIERHKATIGSSVDGLTRRRRNAILRRTSKALGKVSKDLLEFREGEGQTFQQIYAAVLADLLSNAGVEAVLGKQIDWPVPSFRLLESREADSRDGPYNLLEREHYQPTRESILKQNADMALPSFFKQLQRPIDGFLEIERIRNKGGAPSRIYRDYTIQELTSLYVQLFGMEPTSTPNGQFCTLCEIVLEELGEDTKGLDSAVMRILKGFSA